MEETKEFLLIEAKQFVNHSARPEIPPLTSYIPQSITFNCRYCGKEYSRQNHYQNENIRSMAIKIQSTMMLQRE